MANNFIGILSRHKHIIILSIAVIALGLYIVPIDHMFAVPGVEAKKNGGSDNKYGHNRFGPPPDHGGNNPGNGGGSPPGNTPGGSDIPPGLQKNPSKHTLTSQSNTNDNGKGNGKDNGNGDNGGGSNTNNVASHKTSGKENGNGNGDNGGGSNTNNVASHKNSKGS